MSREESKVNRRKEFHNKAWVLGIWNALDNLLYEDACVSPRSLSRKALKALISNRKGLYDPARFGAEIRSLVDQALDHHLRTLVAKFGGVFNERKRTALGLPVKWIENYREMPKVKRLEFFPIAWFQQGDEPNNTLAS